MKRAIVFLLALVLIFTAAVWGCDAGMKFTYNGIALPPLPEWDREAYPYAYITQQLDYPPALFAILYAVDRPGYLDTGSHKLHSLDSAGGDATIQYCKWVVALNEDAADALQNLGRPGITTTVWMPEAGGETSSGLSMIHGPYWTNAELLDQDGNVFLAASDPVPVWAFCDQSFRTGLSLGLSGTARPAVTATDDSGTVSTIAPEPVSLTMGWLVGRRIAVQRRKDTVDATLENGILYVKNASAVLSGGILEVT